MASGRSGRLPSSAGKEGAGKLWGSQAARSQGPERHPLRNKVEGNRDL